MLPEVYKRRLYYKKGFNSIFEFAAKLGGASEEQVRRILNLEKKFEDKPILKSMLVNGEVSINKLARIASIVTHENEEILAQQVKILPQNAIEVLVRDQRVNQESVRTHTNPQPNLEMSNDEHDLQLLQKFSPELKAKLHELLSKEIDINALLLELLQKNDLEIAQEKEKIAAEQNQEQKHSRYIPARIKKILQQEHGTKCSINTCKKPSQNFHHTQRFAMAGTHDPHYIAPLCRDHHTIAHSIDRNFHDQRAKFFKR